MSKSAFLDFNILVSRGLSPQLVADEKWETCVSPRPPFKSFSLSRQLHFRRSSRWSELLQLASSLFAREKRLRPFLPEPSFTL